MKRRRVSLFFCSHFFPPCGLQAFQVPGLPRPLMAATGAPCEAKKSPFQVARWRPRLMDGRVAPPHPSPFLQWTLFHAGHHHLLRCFAPFTPCLSPAPCRLLSPCPVASRFGFERAAKNGICLAKQCLFFSLADPLVRHRRGGGERCALQWGAGCKAFLEWAALGCPALAAAL